MAAVGSDHIGTQGTRERKIFVDLKSGCAVYRRQAGRAGLGRRSLVGDDRGFTCLLWRGKHADCAKVGINSIRRDSCRRPAGQALDENHPTGTQRQSRMHGLHRAVAATEAPQTRTPRLERVDPARTGRRAASDQTSARLVLTRCVHPRGHSASAAPLRGGDRGAHVVVIGRGVTVGMGAACC